MIDGYFIHTDTTEVQVKLLLFKQNELDDNPPLVTFVKVSFYIHDAGSIIMSKSMTIFNPTPYDGTVYAVLRIILEVGFLLGIVVNMVTEIREFVKACRQSGRCHEHLTSLWNVLDAVTIFFQLLVVFLWLECLTSLTENAFSPQKNYDVYNIDPACPGANLASFDEVELTKLRLLYESAEHYQDKYIAYRGLCTVVFILMTFQLLHVLHFQPKLSLITRTMSAAWDDLTHLFILFTLVELAFALLGTLKTTCELAVVDDVVV